MNHTTNHARAVIEGTPCEGLVADDVFISTHGRRFDLASLTLCAPCTPTKIIGVGRNYADHIAEMKNVRTREPLLFLKPPSALNHPDGEIVYPELTHELHYEGELAVVIGRRCHSISEEEADACIWGYTVCNDVTARDLQGSDHQWARAKGMDGFAPLGPWITSGIDPADLRLRTYLNGELKQEARTSSMLYSVPALVAYASAAFTLERGDVITTGTPSGVGPMQPGDVVEVEIEKIGVLRNRVVGHAPQR
ncbi:MAG: 2-hydroxyhepta-2,4-diene-1,7-dioate isomerase [Candidatus Eremiobacter antarcticus]|nr:fumarylacetoacetate hydrolase family protein [Candidatus Eremiobacteraeota bacterium]MBC5808961.1 fumarylacetoacetate hydrolase family protein [Candidatus Eremiobacteraeota bacterium]PZR60531.1 MAG: 2-hydroxyhepta-2,4-diene-1,7-dioate isomerase [Candidatus Eremiobacter sp. RRmetagenome_bin22]